MTTKDTETFETNDDLRAAYDRQKASTAAAEGKLEAITFKALSLDPKKGIGKALKMTYEGAIEPDALASITETLANDFDYTPPSAERQPDPEPEPKSVNPDVSNGEREVQEIHNQSEPAPIDPNATATEKAAEEGDWAAVFEIGLNQQGVKIGSDL